MERRRDSCGLSPPAKQQHLYACEAEEGEEEKKRPENVPLGGNVMSSEDAEQHAGLVLLFHLSFERHPSQHTHT